MRYLPEKAGLNTASEISNSLIDKMSFDEQVINDNSNNINLQNINLSPSSRFAENIDSESFQSKDLSFKLSIFKVSGNYIISETENGLILIDQHAAHERIVLEKIREGFLNSNIQKQILLIPEVVELSGDHFNNYKIQR